MANPLTRRPTAFPFCSTITYNVSRWRNNKLLGIKTISEEVPAGRSVTKVRSDSGTSDEDLSLLLREEGGEEVRDKCFSLNMRSMYLVLVSSIRCGVLLQLQENCG